MASAGNIKMDITEIITPENTTVKIEVVGIGRYKFRVRLAGILLKAAARLLNCGIEITETVNRAQS